MVKKDKKYIKSCLVCGKDFPTNCKQSQICGYKCSKQLSETGQYGDKRFFLMGQYGGRKYIAGQYYTYTDALYFKDSMLKAKNEEKGRGSRLRIKILEEV